MIAAEARAQFNWPGAAQSRGSACAATDKVTGGFVKSNLAARRLSRLQLGRAGRATGRPGSPSAYEGRRDKAAALAATGQPRRSLAESANWPRRESSASPGRGSSSRGSSSCGSSSCGSSAPATRDPGAFLPPCSLRRPVTLRRDRAQVGDFFAPGPSVADGRHSMGAMFGGDMRQVVRSIRSRIPTRGRGARVCAGRATPTRRANYGGPMGSGANGAKGLLGLRPARIAGSAQIARSAPSTKRAIRALITRAPAGPTATPPEAPSPKQTTRGQFAQLTRAQWAPAGGVWLLAAIIVRRPTRRRPDPHSLRAGNKCARRGPLATGAINQLAAKLRARFRAAALIVAICGSICVSAATIEPLGGRVAPPDTIFHDTRSPVGAGAEAARRLARPSGGPLRRFLSAGARRAATPFIY